MAEKTCLKCRQPKPVSEFAKNRTKPDGLQGECKACRKTIVPPQLAKYREESTRSASKKGKEWTPEDEAVALDRSLTILEAAQKIGRTFAAVQRRRQLKKEQSRDHDPRTDQGGVPPATEDRPVQPSGDRHRED